MSQEKFYMDVKRSTYIGEIPLRQNTEDIQVSVLLSCSIEVFVMKAERRGGYQLNFHFKRQP